jgi:hypothetical protein
MAETLVPGDEGPNVLILQYQLQQVGYYGAEVDGYFGDDTDDALGRYKRDRGLDLVEPDGCGPETWAVLEQEADRYCGDDRGRPSRCSQESGGDGNPYDTPEERLAVIARAANEALISVGVPTVTFVLDSAAAGYAEFDHTMWVTLVGPEPFEKGRAEHLTAEEQARIAEALYRETLDAEQWFTMARVLTGLHRYDPDVTAAMTGMPPDVVEWAAQYPLFECSVGAGPAMDWYERTFGSDGR